jgi:hypothetical protein
MLIWFRLNFWVELEDMAASPPALQIHTSLPLPHYKHLQLCPERKCKIGMGKTHTQFYRKWSEVKNKLY